MVVEDQHTQNCSVNIKLYTYCCNSMIPQRWTLSTGMQIDPFIFYIVFTKYLINMFFKRMWETFVVLIWRLCENCCLSYQNWWVFIMLALLIGPAVNFYTQKGISRNNTLSQLFKCKVKGTKIKKKQITTKAKPDEKLHKNRDGNSSNCPKSIQNDQLKNRIL